VNGEPKQTFVAPADTRRGRLNVANRRRAAVKAIVEGAAVRKVLIAKIGAATGPRMHLSSPRSPEERRRRGRRS
jgi:hypothetical protein